MADVPQDQLAYVNRLGRVEDEELRALAVNVRELLASDAWRAVVGLVEEAHGNAVQRLLWESAGVDAKVRPHEDLTRLLGFLSGMRQHTAAAEAVLTAHARRERINEQGAP